MPLWALWSIIKARSTIGGVLACAVRNPAVAGCVALSCMFGMLLHEYEVRGRTIARLVSDNARIVSAQRQAQVLALEALNQQKAAYKAKAQEIDDGYGRSMEIARRTSDSYIAHHRAVFMQSSSVANPTSTAPASPQSDGSGLPASMPADSILVSADDLQRCTDASTYALKAHEWAILIEGED